MRQQQCADEFTENWITHREHHFRPVCSGSPPATDQARPSHRRDAYHSNWRKLGRAYRRRHSQYLDVATRLNARNLITFQQLVPHANGPLTWPIRWHVYVGLIQLSD